MKLHLKTWTPRLLLFVMLIALDQWTKHLILAAEARRIAENGARPFWELRGVFEITYAENTGMAFGLFPNASWLFLVIAVITVAAIIFILTKGWVKSPWGVWGAIAVAAGGLGNATDRLLHGFVVDMINPTFMNFFVFNLADVFVVCGGIAVGIYLAFFYEEEQQARKAAKELVNL